MELLQEKLRGGKTLVSLVKDVDPQDGAMMQALISRSSAPVAEHYEKVQKSGSGKFMGKYYIGYGHPAIADCGAVTLYFERVSMLAAKALEQWPLFSGTELSSRYNELRAEDCITVDSADGGTIADIQAGWFVLYRSVLQEVEPILVRAYPRHRIEDEGDYERAIKAKAFDIARGFLPAGSATNLSVHMNFRQWRTHLSFLLVHPLAEVRNIAKASWSLLHSLYPESFTPYRDEIGEWSKEVMGCAAYGILEGPGSPLVTIEHLHLSNYHALKGMLSRRPKGAELPSAIFGDTLQVRFEGPVDFGGFRDLQRHRNRLPVMPLIMPNNFHQWYLERVPECIGSAVITNTVGLSKGVQTLSNESEAQYACALGHMVPYSASMPLNAAVHMLEQRCGQDVHETVRLLTVPWTRQFSHLFPEVALYADLRPSVFQVRRGQQTISEREAV